MKLDDGLIKKAIISAIQDANQRGSIIKDRRIGSGSFRVNNSGEIIKYVIFFRHRFLQFDSYRFFGYVYVNDTVLSIDFLACIDDFMQSDLGLDGLWIDNVKSALTTQYGDLIDFTIEVKLA